MSKIAVVYQNMKTKHKFYLILSVTAFLMIVATMLLNLTAAKTNQMAFEFQNYEQRESINTLLRMKSESFSQILIDYSCYDDLVNFVKEPDPEWAKINLTIIPSYKMQICRVYNLKYEKIFEEKDSLLKHELVIKPVVFKQLDLHKEVQFFQQTKDGLLQICATSIHQSNDTNRKSKPKGYLMFAKLWTNLYIKKLEKLSNAQMKVLDSSATKIPQTKIIIPLQNIDSLVVASIYITKKNLLLENIKKNGVYSLLLVVVFSVLVFFLFFYLFNNLVINPLNKIINSLDTNTEKDLGVIKLQRDEFGKIAKLIIEFFNQQRLLQSEIEERVQIQEELRQNNEELHAQKEEMQWQRDQIAEQRDLIEKKNKKFVESVNAASRIQHALIPPESEIRISIPNHFIFSKPRDVVSGDFYWLRNVAHYVYGTVGDCTGHGVPGAFMSVLGIALLNEITSKVKNESPAEILNLLRSRIIETLHQKNDLNFGTEGMDIVLFRLDTKTNLMETAGAYNPLYITRLNENDPKTRDFIEIKADLMPVGVHPKDYNRFTNHIVQMQKNDRLYLFSDGFQTQFGGAKNQKFSTKRFKELILTIQNTAFDEQKEMLENALSQWQGSQNQVDDVLVMGIEL